MLECGFIMFLAASTTMRLTVTQVKVTLLHTLFPCHLCLYANPLFVRDSLSTLIITESSLKECQDLWIPTRSKAYLPRIDFNDMP